MAGSLLLGALVSGDASGAKDIAIGTTTTQVAAERPHDLCIGRIGRLVQQGGDAHHLARRAKATLKGVGLDKRLLNEVQIAALSQPLNGSDLATHTIDGEQ